MPVPTPAYHPSQDDRIHDFLVDYTAQADSSTDAMDMASQLENQAAEQALQAVREHEHGQAGYSEPDSAHLAGESYGTVQAPISHSEPGPSRALSTTQHGDHLAHPLSSSEQITILREAYARNPNPSKRELVTLAEKTGRPWNKIREYFRQRRNKLRGLEDLEGMREPGRATGWLQITYLPSPLSSISQLSLYKAYQSRFDPFHTVAPLMSGQELIQLACATFPGCAMARDEAEYVLRGLGRREGEAGRDGVRGDVDDSLSGGGEGGYEQADGAGEDEVWERGLDGVVEPLRAGSWLLSTFQQPPDASSSLAQTDLYTSYATRFSLLPSQTTSHPPQQSSSTSYQPERARPTANGSRVQVDPRNANSSPTSPDTAGDPDPSTPANGSEPDRKSAPRAPPSEARENRLLNPVELIALTRMTFPQCEPAVDEHGRFVIRGLERRKGGERSKEDRSGDMFPFALMTAPDPSDPTHPFSALLKRKLQQLHPQPDPEPSAGKRAKPLELSEDDKELVEGLKRFRGSKLGQEVRDVCVSQ